MLEWQEVLGFGGPHVRSVRVKSLSATVFRRSILQIPACLRARHWDDAVEDAWVLVGDHLLRDGAAHAPVREGVAALAVALANRQSESNQRRLWRGKSVALEIARRDITIHDVIEWLVTEEALASRLSATADLPQRSCGASDATLVAPTNLRRQVRA